MITMPAEKTGPDQVRVYYTDAGLFDAAQRRPDSSLGGKVSTSEFKPYAVRRVNAIQGIRIDHVGGGNSVGEGYITVTGASAITWTTPNGDTSAAETITNGETRILYPSGSQSEYIRVTRISADALQGRETVVIGHQYNNLFDDVSNAESVAGDTEYRALAAVNEGAASITTLTLSRVLFPDSLEMASENVNGAPIVDTMDTPADEDTAPTGPTFGTGNVALGAVGAGNYSGFWVKRIIAASASGTAKQTGQLRLAWDTYQIDMPFCYRIAEDALKAVKIYSGLNGSPDFVTPVATISIPGADSWAAAADNDHHLVPRTVNEYGLEAPFTTETIIRIDAGGEELGTRPEAPQGLTLTDSSGDVLIEALYLNNRDGAALKADTWAIWVTSDGSEPDETGAATLEVTMPATSAAAAVPLRVLTGSTYVDNTTVRVKVAARRSGTPDVDSTTIAGTITTSTVPVAIPKGQPWFTDAYAQYPTIATAPTTADNYVIDAGDSVRIEVGNGYCDLYADTVMCWRLVYSGDHRKIYLPSGWGIVNGTPAQATGGDLIEYESSIIHVQVQGVTVMTINPSTQKITVAKQKALNTSNLTFGTGPVWERYDSTQFQVWDEAVEMWRTVMQVNSAGEWLRAIPITQALSQAQIEAL